MISAWKKKKTSHFRSKGKYEDFFFFVLIRVSSIQHQSRRTWRIMETTLHSPKQTCICTHANTHTCTHLSGETTRDTTGPRCRMSCCLFCQTAARGENVCVPPCAGVHEGFHSAIRWLVCLMSHRPPLLSSLSYSALFPSLPLFSPLLSPSLSILLTISPLLLYFLLTPPLFSFLLSSFLSFSPFFSPILSLLSSLLFSSPLSYCPLFISPLLLSTPFSSPHYLFSSLLSPIFSTLTPSPFLSAIIFSILSSPSLTSRLLPSPFLSSPAPSISLLVRCSIVLHASSLVCSSLHLPLGSAPFEPVSTGRGSRSHHLEDARVEAPPHAGMQDLSGTLEPACWTRRPTACHQSGCKQLNNEELCFRFY